MTDDNDPISEAPLFSATITPHRSLGLRGFRTLMIVLGLISFSVGMVFLLAGAWPIFGFFGLDVLLVYLAFRANYRSANAYEQVTVTPSELAVRQVNHHGRTRQWLFNPLWVRLDRETHEDFGLLRLFVVSRELRLLIASFLSPPEREQFAVSLNRALGEAKRGPTRSVFD
jgi:uncharacterized membrane protein